MDRRPSQLRGLIDEIEGFLSVLGIRDTDSRDAVLARYRELERRGRLRSINDALYRYEERFGRNRLHPYNRSTAHLSRNYRTSDYLSGGNYRTSDYLSGGNYRTSDYLSGGNYHTSDYLSGGGNYRTSDYLSGGGNYRSSDYASGNNYRSSGNNDADDSGNHYDDDHDEYHDDYDYGDDDGDYNDYDYGDDGDYYYDYGNVDEVNANGGNVPALPLHASSVSALRTQQSQPRHAATPTDNPAERTTGGGTTELACSICGEAFAELQQRVPCVSLKGCHHVFCQECIDRVLEGGHPRCPRCRRRLNRPPYYRRVYL